MDRAFNAVGHTPARADAGEESFSRQGENSFRERSVEHGRGEERASHDQRQRYHLALWTERHEAVDKPKTGGTRLARAGPVATEPRRRSSYAVIAEGTLSPTKTFRRHEGIRAITGLSLLEEIPEQADRNGAHETPQTMGKARNGRPGYDTRFGRGS